ncbi:MAG: double zinc ribbon domain-containing protein [Dehalococcoidales bacterium]|nr:double zinc ribbon domain-containing protein [Dehalococcoidales bacterium]
MLNVLPQASKLGGIALNLLFPQKCIGCGRGGAFICASCSISLPRLLPPLCPRCGRPQPSGILCPGCVSWQAAIDGIRSYLRFEGVARQMVYQLKYKNLRALSTVLAQFLSEYLLANSVPGEVLVPVPLHEKRLRERGYNQSGLLARELGKLTGLPVVNDCLIRQRHTAPQARTTTVADRYTNITGAFACCDRRLEGKKVLLIDDVATSGATLDAAAAALKAAGATAVWGLTLAREI